MKSLKTGLVLLSISLFSMGLFAQSQSDSLEIKETALNYIEGYFHKDGARMEKALHPELVKRSIQKTKDGTEFIINLGATYMIMRTENNDNRHAVNPDGSIESEVIIYDIVGNAATVKVSTNQYGFIDYLHMGKFEGEWKIINVFWASIPKKDK